MKQQHNKEIDYDTINNNLEIIGSNKNCKTSNWQLKIKNI